MKKLSANIIILFITLPCFSQMNILFHGMPYEKIYVVRDSIKMQLHKLYNYCGYKEKAQDFLFMDTSRHSVNLSFTKYEKGANADLKIQGVWVINNVQITGMYMDLFPIWKKYFNTEADLTETQKTSQQVTIKNTANNEELIIKFIKDSEWMISLHAYPIKN